VSVDPGHGHLRQRSYVFDGGQAVILAALFVRGRVRYGIIELRAAHFHVLAAVSNHRLPRFVADRRLEVVSQAKS
jgi:hypothetical protein